MPTIKHTIAIIALSAFAASASAQDLLANHAPSDRKLTDLKAVKINTANSTIDLSNPAGDIYSTWDNKSALIAPGTLPANFKVDLRGFAMPTPSRKITSQYGPRWGKQHKGIDVKVYIGDTIYAAFDGKVRIAKYNAGGWGYYIVLRHPNGLETLYGHLSRQLVKEDQIVRAGQPIGLGGATGHVTGSHLHFETRLLGQAINPALMFDFEAQDVTGDFYVVKSGTIQNSKQTAVAQTNKTTATTTTTTTTPAPAATKTTQQLTESRGGETSQNQQEPEATRQETTYIVKDGDNLFRIAQNHGLTLDQLCRLNGLNRNSVIVRGQVLKCS
ncbi:MAG: peptidoglycan DD-metalloendopeptidase family protein [Bacteroidaceae bacterium]|nr:peptidoglycan DD-metalloendopeptidase family protein [Bacteroidaceae bacterium]MBQ9176157.1 peptidoglycan DD-metalloendopeptidase family protein [Bacteroidaceae bacterium]MBR1379314.1 peptidoglycan DD-metalloendopeptidase family protein [Bacteroidaceae bacterium]